MATTTLPRPAGASRFFPAELQPDPRAGSLPVAFQFTVTFGTQPQDSDGSFQEVQGIGPELETEDVAEGGENRFVHHLPKGMKHPRLVLKRGIAPNSSRLVQWCQAVLEGGLVRPVYPKLLHVFLLDENGGPLRAWSFDNAFPVRWEVEAFGAHKNEVALETIELSYNFSKREV